MAIQNIPSSSFTHSSGTTPNAALGAAQAAEHAQTPAPSADAEDSHRSRIKGLVGEMQSQTYSTVVEETTMLTLTTTQSPTIVTANPVPSALVADLPNNINVSVMFPYIVALSFAFKRLLTNEPHPSVCRSCDLWKMTRIGKLFERNY